MKKFDWENPKLYKGSSTHYGLWVGCFYLLCAFGLWFTFYGGAHVLWSIISKVLSL